MASASGKPARATGYMGWLFLCEAPVLRCDRAAPSPQSAANFAPRTVILGLMGGLAAVTAYGLVLYVKTIAPLGAVSAVRESSVIIAALIGVGFIWRTAMARADCCRRYRGSLGVVALSSCSMNDTMVNNRYNYKINRFYLLSAVSHTPLGKVSL